MHLIYRYTYPPNWSIYGRVCALIGLHVTRELSTFGLIYLHLAWVFVNVGPGADCFVAWLAYIWPDICLHLIWLPTI